MFWTFWGILGHFQARCHIIPPVSSSLPWSLLPHGFTCISLPREESRRHPIQLPEPYYQIISRQRSSSSNLSSLIMSELLSLSLRLNRATLQRKIISDPQEIQITIKFPVRRGQKKATLILFKVNEAETLVPALIRTPSICPACERIVLMSFIPSDSTGQSLETQHAVAAQELMSWREKFLGFQAMQDEWQQRWGPENIDSWHCHLVLDTFDRYMWREM